MNSNVPLATLPTSALTRHERTMAYPCKILDPPLRASDNSTDVPACGSSLPGACTRYEQLTLHDFLPAMKLRHSPVEGDATSMVSASTLISHDRAAATATPSTFIIKFLPKIFISLSVCCDYFPTPYSPEVVINAQHNRLCIHVWRRVTRPLPVEHIGNVSLLRRIQNQLA